MFFFLLVSLWGIIGDKDEIFMLLRVLNNLIVISRFELICYLV